MIELIEAIAAANDRSIKVVDVDGRACFFSTQAHHERPYLGSTPIHFGRISLNALRLLLRAKPMRNDPLREAA